MPDMQGIAQNIVISRDKSIYVPEIIKKSIVQRDHNVDCLTFDCPRYWNGIDISKLNIYVNYIAAGQKKQGGEPESFLCENVVEDEDNPDIFHFDWRITSNVSEFPDKLIFIVCAKSVDAEGNEELHWNSRLCTDLEVQEGLEASAAIVEKYPDVIEQIIQKLKYTEGASPEQIAAAVEEYMIKNPITETDPTVPDWAKEPQKPSYTASEVGALPNNTKIPSKTSDLENDSKFLIQPESAKVGQTFRVKSVNEDGTMVLEAVDITSGTGGKSAYQYAQEGGYTGTEEEFTQKMAAEYLTTETDPTVPGWAKQAEKPTYTADEVGALPDNTNALPNPQKLTFSGAVTAEYDGSGAVTVVIPEGSGGSGGTARIEKLSTDTSVELEPNKLYVFPEMESLTITLAEPSNTAIVNEYHFVFQSGSTATTLTIPETVKIPSSFSVDASKIYEISILEGCLCVQSWAVN